MASKEMSGFVVVVVAPSVPMTPSAEEIASLRRRRAAVSDGRPRAQLFQRDHAHEIVGRRAVGGVAMHIKFVEGERQAAVAACCVVAPERIPAADDALGAAVASSRSNCALRSMEETAPDTLETIIMRCSLWRRVREPTTRARR